MTELVLFNAPQSTCSQRVRFVLHAKGLPFDERKLDLFAGNQLKPDYLKVNPNGVVPSLLHDGRAMLISGEDENRGKVVAFDFRTGGTWTALPDMLEATSRTSATVLDDGTVLVVGGVTSTDPYTLTQQAERFYP